MPFPPITLDLTRSLLVCDGKQVRIPSHVGALFLQSLLTMSGQGQGLTFEGWRHQLQSLGHTLPDRTTMRRRLAEMERCFEALGCAGASPVVLAPARGATVGPWRLREDLRVRLAMPNGDEAALNGMARLTVAESGTAVELGVMHCFLVGDDLARNGMFADAASSMAKALTMHDLSPELRCVLYFRQVKYLRRAGHYSRARESLGQVTAFLPELGEPMLGHIQAELAVQDWRLKYDDVANADKYAAFTPPHADPFADFHSPLVDARLLWQQFNLWASEWRRQMEVEDLAAVQTAFNHAREGYQAATYWALANEDCLNVMNVAANMGYLMHLSGQKGLADLSVEALDWLLVSQAYIERFEWPEESLWDYVYLAELYLSSKTVRQHLERQGAYVMNSLTPDCEEFYTYALSLGVRLGEPRQLASMYQLFIQYLQSVGQPEKVKKQKQLLDVLLDQNPGLREKLSPGSLNP